MRFYHGVINADQVAALQQPPIPGDANSDGKVDAADARILANHWGEQVLGASRGDFNNDGNVDAADVSIMGANWGDHTESGETATVPEPSMMILIGFGVLMPAAGRRYGGRPCGGY